MVIKKHDSIRRRLMCWQKKKKTWKLTRIQDRVHDN